MRCTAPRSRARGKSRIAAVDRLTLRRPDDWHLHLRDGPAMGSVLADTARRFARAIVMPNLKPPVTTVEQALAYRERILAALPPGMSFEPLMTLYLTDDTSPEEISRAKLSGRVHGVKYYPAGATTHSEAGVTRISRCFRALERMEEVGLPLLVHGEVTDPAVDVFDREKAFIEEVLGPLVERFHGLKVVLEHITTREAVQYVEVTGANIAATITAHHLLMNRNALFMGGIRPHHYCLPVLKREEHREALVEAATSGNPKFFLGTDSAPHERGAKEAACGCAGIYTAHAALELYAVAFEEAGALDRLEDFASRFGAAFYGLPQNEGTVTLVRESWTVPETLPFGDGTLVPLRAGEEIPWKLI
jgi:dihydroorotase